MIPKTTIFFFDSTVELSPLFLCIGFEPDQLIRFEPWLVMMYIVPSFTKYPC